MATNVLRRHIQDHNEANTTQRPHWGYASRVLPCSSGAGTCEYLDAVYWMHDISMLYTFVLWGVLLGAALLLVTVRGWRMGGPTQSVGSPFDKLCDRLSQRSRRWLLPDAPIKWLFGRVSRLQVLILGVMSVYLLVFSLVGITYKTWITPVEESTLYNTRTGIGGWADRVGALAYALTPFTILLSNRESVLSVVTGIPYQHFNFLHRWLGRIIFVQGFLHTLGWTIIEGKLYQPQPLVYVEFMSQMYAVFGVVAMFLITLILVLSTETAIRWTGYTVFKITHWILAILYIAACWGHWDRLWCWMVASLALIVIDQTIRALRSCYLHATGRKGAKIGFRCAEAQVVIFGAEDEDRVVRLDFEHKHREPWKAGQHFHLCFPSLSIWQSHPFTPSSSPNTRTRTQQHTYIMRVRKGQTARVANLGDGATVPTLLTGPYGIGYPRHETQNVLAVAGGTGVTFTLPVTFAAINQNIVPQATVDFVWIIRQAQDMLWIASELLHLMRLLTSSPGLRIHVFITRECNHGRKTSNEKSSSDDNSTDISSTNGRSSLKTLLECDSPRFTINWLGDHHPSASSIIQDFMERAESSNGSVSVIASGPGPMGSDLRTVVAEVRRREALEFYWDSRERH